MDLHSANTFSEMSSAVRDMAAECAACGSRRLTIYGDLSADELEDLARIRHSKRSFSARDVVAREGDQLRYAYTIRSGWASRYKLMPDGRKQILSFLLPGNHISAGLDTPIIRYAVEAITDLDVCIFGFDDFLAFTSTRTQVLLGALRSACTRLDSADERIVNLGRRSAHHRVVFLIMEIERRLKRIGVDTEKPFEFPLRQKHIADALGLTPPHIGRIMGELEDAGIMSVSRRMLHIMDRHAIEDVYRISSALD